MLGGGWAFGQFRSFRHLFGVPVVFRALSFTSTLLVTFHWAILHSFLASPLLKTPTGGAANRLSEYRSS